VEGLCCARARLKYRGSETSRPGPGACDPRSEPPAVQWLMRSRQTGRAKLQRNRDVGVLASHHACVIKTTTLSDASLKINPSPKLNVLMIETLI
jgi:hypothetical protein